MRRAATLIRFAMHAGKLILLTLVVVLLAAVAWWRSKEPADPLAARGEVALTPGLDTARLSALRIENVGRQSVVRLERDGQGTWWMVEPLLWRADGAHVRSLIEATERARGTLAEGIEPNDAGLAPPRFVLELIEDRRDGSERRHRIAYGASDIGGTRVFARLGELASGPLVRAPAAAIALLDLPVNEYRERRLLDVAWSDVIRFARRGSLVPPSAEAPIEGDRPGAPRALDLEAEPETLGWFATQPVRVGLDPQAVGLLLRAATQLRARGFYADAPTDLAQLGLEPPLFTMEFEVRGEEPFEIHVGNPVGDDAPTFDERNWLARLAGRPNVVRLEGLDVRLLASPLAYLVDHQLARFDRNGTRAVTVELDGLRVELNRLGERWTVRVGAGEDSGHRPADAGRVGDLLTAIERLELLGYPWLAEPGGGPQDIRTEGRLEVRVAALDGGEDLVLGGAFAARIDVGGVVGRPFRRFGEEAFGLLAEEDLERLLPAPKTLLSTVLLQLVELEQNEVRVEGLGRERSWIRDPSKGHWGAVGTDLEDKRFALLVDSLLTVRAVEFLAPAGDKTEAEPVTLGEPLRVAVRAADGSTRRYTLGKTSVSGAVAVVADVDGARATVAPAVYERLRELLDVR